MQRPVLDSIEVRKMSYIGLHKGERRSQMEEGKQRVIEVNGDQSEACSRSLDHAQSREFEVPK